MSFFEPIEQEFFHYQNSQKTCPTQADLKKNNNNNNSLHWKRTQKEQRIMQAVYWMRRKRTLWQRVEIRCQGTPVSNINFVSSLQMVMVSETESKTEAGC